ncbi:hypothetical protein ACH5RR_032156 [Cinchona calisaya]|uniref:Uncharacterized protein n=1 Tax=Cinchona calisaya TaxID=153742 RepID=A0ABD2YH97_9GENT
MSRSYDFGIVLLHDQKLAFRMPVLRLGVPGECWNTRYLYIPFPFSVDGMYLGDTFLESQQEKASDLFHVHYAFVGKDPLL